MDVQSRPTGSSETTVARSFFIKLPSLRSLRAQLTGAILLVLTAGLAVLLMIAGAEMSTTAYQAFTRQQEALAILVANSISEPSQFSPDYLGTRLPMELGGVQSDTNLSVVDGTNTPIAWTSAASLNSGTAPETLEALHGSIVSEIQNNRLFIAAPVIHDGHQILGAVLLDTSLSPVNDDLRNRWLALIGAAIGALVLGAFAAWRLETQIVRPLSELRMTAGQMAEGHLEARAHGVISAKGTADELIALGKAFNYMAEQVEAMIARQREFVANASHELRAPLSAI